MAYIYKITNDINDKIYIGKTYHSSIETRFKEHCKDSQRERCEQRPLYSAMNKYGVEHFSIELVEECDNPEEREKFWIEYYGSFKYGYNATIGGDGKPYCDYELIYRLFKKGLTLKDIAMKTGYCADTCAVAVKAFNVSQEEIIQRGREKSFKAVCKIDKDSDEILCIYPSITAAYKEMGKQQSGHIASVCRGKRKTAYGYKWQYV